VINPLESHGTRQAGPDVHRVTEMQHNKCLAELERCCARERVMEQEVAHLRRQLEGHQADVAALKGSVPQHSLPRVGRAAVITDVSGDKEPYLGWLCTIVGQREDNHSAWVLRLMWSHPLGDVVQLPAEGFLVHPAIDRMKLRLADLSPCRQPRCSKAEVEALEARIKHVASDRGHSHEARTSMSSQASPARHGSIQTSSDSPILVRSQGRAGVGNDAADSRAHADMAGTEAATGRRVRMRSSLDDRSSRWMDKEEKLLDEAIENAGLQRSAASLPSSGSSSIPASSLSAESDGRRPVPRGQREQSGWTQEEEARLTDGHMHYGSQWEMIRKKCNLLHRTGMQLRDKWRNLKAATRLSGTSE